MAAKKHTSKKVSKKAAQPMARRGSSAAMAASVPSLLKQAGLR